MEMMILDVNKLLKNINVKKIKYPNSNLTYEQILKSETQRFKDILQDCIDDYYNSYMPVIYKRGAHGGNLRDSLTVDNVCKISSNGKTLTCSVLVDEDAIHESILDGSDANVFWLLNDERAVKKNVSFKNIYRMGYYEGYHFVEKAVEEFERTNRYGIKVEVIRPLLYY